MKDKLKRDINGLALLEEEIKMNFFIYANKCKHRQLVKGSPRLDYVDWHSCKNNKHIYSFASIAVCDYKLCPHLEVK